MRNDNKEYLYYIIDQYKNKVLNARQFCDEFYICYGKKIVYSTLSNKELTLFDALSTVTSRFSEFIEDHLKYPGVYFDNAFLDLTITEISEKLKIK